MSVRFDASGELYTRSTSLGTITAVSVACWLKISTLHSFYSTAWEFGTSSNGLTLRTDTDGTTMGVTSGITSNSLRASRNLTVGTWYYFGVAVSLDAGTGLMVSARDTDGSFTVNTWSEPAAGISFNNLRIGQGVAATTWYFNGCVAALKIWSGAALTQSELEAEAAQFAPVRTSNLYAYYRFATASTTDNSGNGQTLSGGTGTTSEGDPSLSTQIAVADTGAGVEALTASTSTSLTQAGAAADALVAARVIPLADAGAGTDTIAANATVPLGDTGTAVDTGANGQPIFFPETGAATDAITAAVTGTALAQAGAAVDTVGVTASAVLTNAAGAVDALTYSEVLFPVVGDTATAVDALTYVDVRDRDAVAGPPRRSWSSRPPTI